MVTDKHLRSRHQLVRRVRGVVNFKIRSADRVRDGADAAFF